MASATSTPAARGGRRGACSPSPGQPPRVQERGELRHLNDRLANYIQRVQELEQEKGAMLLRLQEQEEATARETRGVRRLYEEELADVRRALDELAAERARLQIEQGNQREDILKLQSRWARAREPRPPRGGLLRLIQSTEPKPSGNDGSPPPPTILKC